MAYNHYTSSPGTFVFKDEGVEIEIDVDVYCRDGLKVDKRVLDEAVERAVDYIIEEAVVES